MNENQQMAEFLFVIESNVGAYEILSVLPAFCTGQLPEEDVADDSANHRFRRGGGAIERKDFIATCGAEAERGFARIICREKVDSSSLGTTCAKPLDAPGSGAFKRRRRQDDAGQWRMVKIETKGGVGILFSEEPTPEQIALMRDRARLFAENWLRDYLGGIGKPMRITGFRLLRRPEPFTELPLPAAA
jgi:hypothetical protein